MTAMLVAATLTAAAGCAMGPGVINGSTGCERTPDIRASMDCRERQREMTRDIERAKDAERARNAGTVPGSAPTR